MWWSQQGHLEAYRKVIEGREGEVLKSVLELECHNNLDFDSCYNTKNIKSLPIEQYNRSPVTRWELVYQICNKFQAPS